MVKAFCKKVNCTRTRTAVSGYSNISVILPTFPATFIYAGRNAARLPKTTSSGNH